MTRFLAIAVFLTLLFLGLKQAFAHEWLSGYKTPAGTGCCNETDCRPMAAGFWVKKGDKLVVFPGEKPTTITIVHPSADKQGRTWICNTGCAFVSRGF